MPNSPYFGSVYFQSPYFGGGEDAYEDYSVTLRKIIATLIRDGQEGNLFLFNDFTIEETHFNYEDLVQLNKDHPSGKLYLCALPYDQENISRSNVARQVAPILIGYVRGRVDPNNVILIDRLISFMGQIQFVVRHFDPEHYSWTRTEAIKDDNGVPYGFQQMARQGIFESYFIPYFNMVVT